MSGKSTDEFFTRGKLAHSYWLNIRKRGEATFERRTLFLHTSIDETRDPSQ